MTAPDALHRLAELYGIEPGYTDFYGNRKEVAQETICALLAAMGAAVGSDAEIADSLREAEARPWRRLLEPVQVIAPPERLEILFSLPAGRHGEAVHWRLFEEGGALYEGTAAVDRLEVMAEGTVEGDVYRRRRLPLQVSLAHGYHQLHLKVAGGVGGAFEGAMSVVLAPDRCFGARAAEGEERLWGFATQLYGVRSERNWGMGDLTDLARLAEFAAEHGASLIGVNPLHCLFPADPNHISPYSPSSRFFLNVLYIDPEAVPDLRDSESAQALLADDGFRTEVEQARAVELVDYPAVARLKLPVLERLYGAFREHHLSKGAPSARGLAFLVFKDEMGPELERQAIFDALHEHSLRTAGAWSWQNWPEPYRRPDSPEVATFAAENRERVDFFFYLQWVADQQLAEAHDGAKRAGMPVGLYRDLAIAVNPAGAMAWAHPGVSLATVNVGAPPDWFNPTGQNWALAPLSPVGMREGAYAAFITGLRQNMRHAGAIRIDHVMGLQRLYWIPIGATAAEGAYVRYRFDDLARLIALESERQKCLVIGEDLGTVPEGFRPLMQQAGIMSCRVLYFERGEGGEFLPPEHYPEHALVSVSTHDLPTLRGFWTYRDVRWRDVLNLFPDAEAFAAAWKERDRDRRLLLEALDRAGLLPPEIDPQDPPEELPEDLLDAVHRFLARTPCRLLAVQLEDALGDAEQPNLPGAEEHPNWRRRLPRTLEELTREPVLVRLADVLNHEGRRRPG